MFNTPGSRLNRGKKTFGNNAGNVTFSPVGTIAATNVQAAIAELESEVYAAIPPAVAKNAPVGLINGTIVASVAGNALTLALKTFAGTDPSAVDPVYAIFRSATAGSGDLDIITITAAMSLTISSGSTLGFVSAINFNLWHGMFNDAGTPRIFAINCLQRVVGPPDELNTFSLGAFGIASSTAEGGAGGADSPHVFYTGTAVANKPYFVTGWASYETALGTAGTWNAAPDRVQPWMLGLPLPGAAIQTRHKQTGATASGTTVLPDDDTIPQNTEGDEYLSHTIIPSSKCSLIDIDLNMHIGTAIAANLQVSAAMFQDSVANALVSVSGGRVGSASEHASLRMWHRMIAASTGTLTFKGRAGPASAGTVTFNGVASARKHGGVMNSFIRIQEIMT